MTFTLDLKHGSRSLPTLYPKAHWGWSMSKIELRGEKICCGQEISDGQTEESTDEQTDHYRAPTEWGHNNLNLPLHPLIPKIHSLVLSIEQLILYQQKFTILLTTHLLQLTLYMQKIWNSTWCLKQIWVKQKIMKPAKNLYNSCSVRKLFCFYIPTQELKHVKTYGRHMITFHA